MHNMPVIHHAMRRVPMPPETAGRARGRPFSFCRFVVMLRSEECLVINAWLHGRSDNTREAYRRDVVQFLSFIDKPLHEIELADVHAWDNDLVSSGMKPATRARKLSALKSLLNFACDQEFLKTNAARRVKAPRIRDGLAERILSEDEITRMIVLEPDARNRILLKMLYAGALRVSELCSLKWKDVSRRTRGQVQLTIFGKGQKTRFVLLPSEVADELLALPGEHSEYEFIFCVNRHKAYRIVRQAAERAGINRNVSPHWLRHAHASHALDHGAPAHLVRDTLGHASLATTSRYAHARPTESSGRYLAI